MLKGVGVVFLSPDVAVGEGALAGLVVDFAERAEVETQSGDDRANPEFDERRMFRVNAEVGALDVGDAGDDVVALIEDEAIEAFGDGGAQDGSEDDGHDEKQEQAKAENHLWAAGCSR